MIPTLFDWCIIQILVVYLSLYSNIYFYCSCRPFTSTLNLWTQFRGGLRNKIWALAHQHDITIASSAFDPAVRMAIRITVIQLGQILKMLDSVCDDRLKYPTLLITAITSRFLSYKSKWCKQFYVDLVQLLRYVIFRVDKSWDRSRQRDEIYLMILNVSMSVNHP